MEQHRAASHTRHAPIWSLNSLMRALHSADGLAQSTQVSKSEEARVWEQKPAPEKNST